jgi:1-phosphofructokinase family hexose kinase
MTVLQPSVTGSEAGRIHVVCPNHAEDRLQVVPRFRPFEVNRASTVRSLAGGKGMIVGRAVRRLGATVAVHGFVGGRAGELVQEECHSLGAEDRNTPISGATRTTVVVIDEHTGGSTVVNEPGPHIEPEELVALYDQLAADLRPGDVVVSTGSIPEGCSPSFHAQVARLALEHGCQVFVDAAGTALEATLQDLRRDPAPVVLKINDEELATAVAATAPATEDLHGTVDRLVDSTGTIVVVTRGPQGAIWRSADRAIVVGAPQVPVRNATGSGDCFMAGLAVALVRRRDPVQAMVLASAMGAANAAGLEPDVDPDLVRRLEAHVPVKAGRSWSSVSGGLT